METSPSSPSLDIERAVDEQVVDAGFGACLAGLADWSQPDWSVLEEPVGPSDGSDYQLPTITTATIAGLRAQLQDYRALLQAGQMPASARVLRVIIEEIESTMSTLCGLQVQAIDAYDRLTRADNAAKGIAARDQGKGVDKAIAMATHSAPSRGTKLVATAKALTHELPCTYRALCSGRISFYRAQIIAAEAAKLPSTQRRRMFDERLAANTAVIETMGIRTLQRSAQALVDELHPVSAAERFAEEVKESAHVAIEELGHGMSRLIATMPTPHAAYIYSVLAAAASQVAPLRPPSIDRKTGGIWMAPRGDKALYEENDVARSERQSRGQAMTTLFNQFINPVDEPVENLGLSPDHTVHTSVQDFDGVNLLDSADVGSDQVSLAPPVPAPEYRLEQVRESKTKAAARPGPNPIAPIPITIDLVISDRTLLGYGEEPAIILADKCSKNLGTIPASIARALVANSADAGITWLRKIYANDVGNLTATSSRQRFFPDGLATLLRLRDQGICRTPWCDSPIRHSDHVIPWRDGGQTCLENGEGLCVRCNQTKEAPGWKTTVNVNAKTEQQEITYTEPTGQTHKSSPPRLPKPAKL